MKEEIPFPVLPMSWTAIDNVVEKYLREEMPLVLSKPQVTDVEKLLECVMARTHDLGVLYDADLAPDIEAQLDPIRGVVHIGRATLLGLEKGLARARFTLAHEAGHVLLHMEFIRENHLKLARMGPRRVESFARPEPQANQAAAAIVMPKVTFVPEYRRIKTRGWSDWEAIAALQNTFGCSERAVDLRITWLKKEGFL